MSQTFFLVKKKKKIENENRKKFSEKKVTGIYVCRSQGKKIIIIKSLKFFYEVKVVW